MNGKKKTKKIFVLNKSVFLFILFIVIAVIGYRLSFSIVDIMAKTAEQKELEQKLETLKEEEKALVVDVKKLQDPDYIARYAREKFLYSKDTEFIIRIPDEE